MSSSEAWSLVTSSLALAVPVTSILGAFLGPRRAVALSAASLVLALGMSLAALAVGASGRAAATFGVRVDLVTCVMLVLVSGIGLVIARYSRAYLQGDAGTARYFRWLQLTLAAVAALVIANNLLVVAAAWTATSLALHQMLTFYGDRTAALVAAHKKFLVSRLADVCLWSSLVLVHLSVGSLDLDRIAAWASAHPDLTPSMHAAAVLVVLAVALRSAQLPFHGWLIQVMEAPTPVSALLHAGVVNIGGFVLIRLAPWMAHATAAQLMLVVIGIFTAVVAALVMTTRVSVKVGLAWSTCAQMGFMLVQCGLGAWDLALLHLVAHSLYKAHAFLSAGTAVERWRVRDLSRPRARPSDLGLGLAVAFALGCAVAAVSLLGGAGTSAYGAELPVWVLAMLVGLSVAPMLAAGTRGGGPSLVARVVSAAGVALLYAGWHAAAAHILPGPPSLTAPTDLGWAIVGVGLLALFALETAFALRPGGRLARRMYPWLFAGLYLDERFTRLTFRLWPPRLPEPASRAAVAVPELAEAQP